jgi:hypothetical protein
MFKSPFSSFASEEKGAMKKAPASKKAMPVEHDDVAKSMTVNQHHDGHYSTEHSDTGEAHDHDNLEALKQHMNQFFDEEESEGDEQSEEMEAPAKKMSVHKGMY